MKNKDILDSWKSISNYLEKDIRTCRRWEQELGLPIHRIDANSTHSKVFAYKSEIDKWLREKANNKNHVSFVSVNKYKIIVISTLLTISLLTAAVLIFKSYRSESEASIPRIAVSPFKSSNTEEYDEYIPEGITNELIDLFNSTQKIAAFPVKSMGQNQKSLLNTKQRQKNLPADYILKGNVEKDSQTIKFNIQLIQFGKDKAIYNGTFSAKPDEIFPMQIRIYQKIIEKLGLIDNKNTLSRETKVLNHDAFDNYLKGNFILNKIKEKNNDPWKLYYKGKYFLGSYTRESIELAINLFNEAIQLDENFAQAYIGLANCYINLVNQNWDFNFKWIEKAEDLLKKAQSISPDSPEYYTTLIKISLIKKIGFNIDTAINLSELANEGIQKYQNDAQLNSIIGYFYFLNYGKYGNQTDFDKAFDYKEKGFWLSPSNIDNINYVELLILNGEFFKAFEVCKIIDQHNPSLFSKFRLGEINYYLGDLEQSIKILQQFNAAPLHYKVDSLFYLGMIASQKGMKQEALRIIDEIILISPKTLILNEDLKMASIYLGLGMEELGFKYLRVFFKKPVAKEMPFICRSYIYIDKNFDNFRADEEFKNIIFSKE